MLVQSLGLEDPLEKDMATHSGILAWKIPWSEESGGWATLCRVTTEATWRAHISITPWHGRLKEELSSPIEKKMFISYSPSSLTHRTHMSLLLRKCLERRLLLLAVLC